MRTRKDHNENRSEKGNKEIDLSREVTNKSDLLRLVFDHSFNGIVVVKAIRNANGRLTDLQCILANESAKRFLGNDLVGRSFVQLYPNGNDQGELEAYNKAIDSGEPIDFERYYNGQSHNKWFRYTAVKLNDGLIIGFEDITDRKKAEEEIRKQYSILRQSEELTKAGSWEYDVNTNQFSWSDGMYNLFNIKKGEIITPTIYSEFVVEEDRQKAEALVANILTKFEALEEVLRIRVNNEVKTIAIKSVPVFNEENQVDKMLGVDRDVTDAKQAEEKILVAKNRELASLNNELKTFNSIAANDYKETLRQLYLSLEFIASTDGGNLSNSGRANVRRAQSAVQRMKLLTDDLVSYSRLQEVGVWEPRVDLNAILQEVLQDFDRRSFLVEAKLDCKPLPYISGYPFLVSLVFHHLIENAVRFKKDSHPPVIKIYCEESVEGSALQYEAARPDTTYHVLTFRDEGIGFPKEETENIFGIFYRLDIKSRHKGSGIGLAICRKIMDMHGGFIIAESEPGVGSAFHCFFPFEARENPPS
jgi:PAS domain S-box-containing protein